MENNVLIAEFMGVKYESQYTFPDYKGDWNYLMVLVKRIDDILYDYSVLYATEADDNLEEFYTLELEGLGFRDNVTIVSCNIEEVYESVIEFIKFYNSIQKS